MNYLITKEGKKLNLSDSLKLWDAPCNPPNTGMRYTEGTDLLAKQGSQSKEWYFWKYSWSLCEGGESERWLVDEEEAIKTIFEHINDTHGYVNTDNCITVFGPDFFKDNA